MALREAWPSRKIKMRRMKTIVSTRKKKSRVQVLEGLLEGDKPSAKIEKIMVLTYADMK